MSAKSSSVIQIKGLTRKFGKFTAVDNLDLSIEEDEIFGLLGPNGAGKTTTLLMLTTVIKPTEGTAVVDGHDVREAPDKARQLIGMAFQEPKLLWVSTPWDVLNWHAKVCGLSTAERKEKVKWILDELGIWHERKKRVHALSGGTRKRVEIAKILIQRPKIAIVDEPTAQIDVVGKHKIWNMVRAMREEGSTILLATNELYEADVLSDRVAIMHKGKLLVCDTPKKLKDSIPGGDVIDIKLGAPASEKIVTELKEIGEVHNVVSIKQSHLRVYLNRAEEVMPEIVSFFVKNNVALSSIRMSEPSLDDVFAHYTGLTIEEAEKRTS